MNSSNMLINKKIALIIGHPGHELRVFRFIELYKPRIYIITDGSGSNRKSRINNSIDILKACGASISPVMGYFTDKEMYRIILEKDFKLILKLLNDILEDLKLNNIYTIVGDAIEGYNPTHDVCRYIINSIVTILEKRTGHAIPNFEFLLDSIPSPEDIKSSEVIKLNNEDFERKYKAAVGYVELAEDFERTIKKYGTEPFKYEYLKEVKKPYALSNWQDIPFYEKYAQQKKEQGVYNEVISFKKHLLPIINQLHEYSQSYSMESEYSHN